MATKKSVGNLTEADLKGKKVLLHADLNVPLDDDQNIADDTRILASVPTIKFLMEKGAKVILASHPGRSEGVTPKYSLKPLVPRLSELLEVDVVMANGCIGEEVQQLAASLPDGGVLLLEFDAEEEKNDPELAKKLASVADIYVNDAFAHGAPLEGKTLPGVFAYEITEADGSVVTRSESRLEDKMVIDHIPTDDGGRSGIKVQEGKTLPGVFAFDISDGIHTAMAIKNGLLDKTTSHHISSDDDGVSSELPVGKSRRTFPDDFAYEITDGDGSVVTSSESGLEGKNGGRSGMKVQEGKGLSGVLDLDYTFAL